MKEKISNGFYSPNPVVARVQLYIYTILLMTQWAVSIRVELLSDYIMAFILGVLTLVIAFMWTDNIWSLTKAAKEWKEEEEKENG